MTSGDSTQLWAGRKQAKFFPHGVHLHHDKTQNMEISIRKFYYNERIVSNTKFDNPRSDLVSYVTPTPTNFICLVGTRLKAVQCIPRTVTYESLGKSKQCRKR